MPHTHPLDRLVVKFRPALIVIALLMIAVNFTLSWLAVRLERRLRRSRRAPRPLDPETIEQEGAPGATVKRAD